MTQAGLSNFHGCWGSARWPAFLWAMAFAGIHGYWLDDGRLGLPSDVLMTTGSALYWSALIAIPILGFVGAVALAGGRRGVPITSRQTLWILGGVAVFCVLHAVPSCVHVAWALAFNQPLALAEREWHALAYEANWLMGGSYFWMAHLAVRREAKRDQKSS